MPAHAACVHADVCVWGGVWAADEGLAPSGPQHSRVAFLEKNSYSVAWAADRMGPPTYGKKESGN